MDIRQAILQEHSKRQTLRIVNYIGADSKRFAILVKLFLGNEYRVTQRAAWALGWCGREHPALLRPWLKKIVYNLHRQNLHVAVKRNTLRILREIELPENLMGAAAQSCFRFLMDKNEAVAVKANAMSVLVRICSLQPGLKQETKLVIEDILPFGTAAIRSRGNKVLKDLEKINTAPTGPP